MKEIIYKEECFRIIGACFEVYNSMGCGFLEPVYQECLKIEMEDQKIPHVEQKELKISYKKRKLRKTYKADFICFGKIIVELKTVSALTDEHRAQVLNYLNATGMKLGLLINFGHYMKLEYERIVLEQKMRSS